jgi:hypothetical protein
MPKWSKEEEEILRRLWPDEKALESLLKRDFETIRVKAKRLGLPPIPRPNKIWSKEEDELLSSLYRQRVSLKEIVARLGRSYHAVQRRTKILGLVDEMKWKPRREYSLTEAEKGYIAGILDGEGNVGVLHAHGPQWISARVQITNTDERLIKWLQEKLGGVTRVTNRQTSKQKTAYALIIEDMRDVKYFLNTIKSYLIVKKEQAELLLKFVDSRIKGWRNKSYSKEEMEMWKKLGELNRRGPHV